MRCILRNVGDVVRGHGPRCAQAIGRLHCRRPVPLHNPPVPARRMKRILQILFWSVIPAAFIGPGTVTTCASAGAGFGYALLWALTFSTIATVVLQEASARVTIVSGRNLAEAIRDRFRGGATGFLVLLLVLGAVVLG